MERGRRAPIPAVSTDRATSATGAANEGTTALSASTAAARDEHDAAVAVAKLCRAPAASGATPTEG
jgi:hypothetical protein